MPTIYEMSTDQVEPKRRSAYWQDSARAIGGMVPHAADWQAFEGEIRRSMLDHLNFGRIRATPHDAYWTRDLTTSQDDAFLRLLFQCKGTSRIEHGDTRFLLHAGEWTVLNASRPHFIGSEEAIEEMLIVVPRSVITPRLFDATRKLGKAHSADSNMARLLFVFVATMLDQDVPGASALDDHLEGAGTELIRALVSEAVGSQEPSTCREIRIQRIAAYIERHICDPNLSVDSIAKAMCCSRRYVHSLFAGGSSVHSVIWNTRLDRCARDLRRRDMADARITSIALSHGFSCPAHFSRMFKAKHGLPPRDYRAQMLDS